jgi:hypothetical protein
LYEALSRLLWWMLCVHSIRDEGALPINEAIVGLHMSFIALRMDGRSTWLATIDRCVLEEHAGTSI